MFARGRFVKGEWFDFLNHYNMAALSYVKPSDAIAGSLMSY